MKCVSSGHFSAQNPPMAFPLTQSENRSPHHYCKALEDLHLPACPSYFSDLSPTFLSLAHVTIPLMYQTTPTPGRLHLLFCCFCMAPAPTSFFVSLCQCHLLMWFFWPPVENIIIHYISYTFPAFSPYLFLVFSSSVKANTLPVLCTAVSSSTLNSAGT